MPGRAVASGSEDAALVRNHLAFLLGPLPLAAFLSAATLDYSCRELRLTLDVGRNWRDLGAAEGVVSSRVGRCHRPRLRLFLLVVAHNWLPLLGLRCLGRRATGQGREALLFDLKGLLFVARLELLNAVQFLSLLLDFALFLFGVILEHSDTPGLLLRRGYNRLRLVILLLAFAAFGGVFLGDNDGRCFMSYWGWLPEGREVRKTGHVDHVRLLVAVLQNGPGVENGRFLLDQAFRFLLLLDDFGLLGGKARLHIDSRTTLLKVSEEIFIQGILVLDEECGVELLVGPVEVVVELEEHKGGRGPEDVLTGLLVGPTACKESDEEVLVLGRDPEVHHKLELGEAIRVEAIDCEVHLVLLRLIHYEAQSVELASFEARLDVSVEELVDLGQFVFVGCMAVQQVVLVHVLVRQG